MAQVVLQNACKRYGNGALAVDNFSLTVEDGEFLVLVGPSGCGKSTTLRMVAGLEEITSGTLLIDGRDVTHVPPKDRDIAMVFQNYALYPHMTVYQNMAFGLKLRKIPREEIDRRVQETAQTLGLSDLLKRLPKQLSGGQRQRVALGRAIVRQPKVFLFDEPLSNLDAKMRVEMRGEIRRLHDLLRATMIYVTHDQIEAMTMGDRIVVMNQGKIQQTAAPLTVYRHPANTFVAGFIGTPPMNLLRVQAKKRDDGESELSSPAVSLTMPTAVFPEGEPPAEVIFGFRPEAVAPEAPADERHARITGRVELVEPMGAETFVHLVLPNGSRATARLAPDVTCRAGDEITLAIALSRCCLFHAETGVAFYTGGTE